MSARRTILCCGAAHLDRRGRTYDAAKLGVSNPGSVFEELGGVAFNVARNLAHLAHPVAMLWARGGDSVAFLLAKAMAELGIADHGVPIPNAKSASYTAILDKSGDLIIALGDMAIYDAVTEDHIEAGWTAAAGVRVLILDANLTEPAIRRAVDLAQRDGVPVIALATSAAKCRRLIPVADKVQTIFMNKVEAETLSGVGAGGDFLTELRAMGIRSAYVTDGPGPIQAYDQTGAASFTPPPVHPIKDVTGAGDAFSSGAARALLDGADLHAVLRAGAAASRTVLQSDEAAPASLTPDALAQTIAAFERTPSQ